MEDNLLNLTVDGQKMLIESEKTGRSFEVYLRPDNKFEVLDLQTGKDYAINVNCVESLQNKDYEDAEILDILIYLKDALEISYTEITAALDKISEVYASPDWVIGEIENMTIGQLLDVFKSDSPVKIFKKISD